MATTFFTITKDPLRTPSFVVDFITGMLIWSMLIPIALLHAWTWVYQEIYFSSLDIPKVRLKDHLTFDRSELKQLSFGQTLACAYCAYANGTISWIKTVINRTETYSCSIKHKTPKLGQEHQADFFPYEKFL